MTQEEFKKRMRVLQGKSVAIEREMKNLQNEYLPVILYSQTINV